MWRNKKIRFANSKYEVMKTDSNWSRSKLLLKKLPFWPFSVVLRLKRGLRGCRRLGVVCCRSFQDNFAFPAGPHSRFGQIRTIKIKEKFSQIQLIVFHRKIVFGLAWPKTKPLRARSVHDVLKMVSKSRVKSFRGVNILDSAWPSSRASKSAEKGPNSSFQQGILNCSD